MKTLAFILLTLPALVYAECRVTSAAFESDGQFKTETVTVCKEGETVAKKIKKGDTILETEVGKSNSRVTYFRYQNTTCRLFTERLTQEGNLRVYHGVICQIDNSPTNWLVVDKW
jgi:hypothetical protein